MALHVRYFCNAFGNILLPPDDATRCPSGYESCEANTLPEIDMLRDRLVAQTRRELDAQAIRDEYTFGAKRKATLDSLTTKLASSTTSEYEKEFIRYYLQLRDEEKRKNYQKRFACDTAYFELRELDKARTPEEFIGEAL